MLGIVFYSGLAYGLGLLVPRQAQMNSPGLRFAAGAVLLIIAIYACAVVFALSLGMSVAAIAALAALGWGRAALGFDRDALASAATHPAFLLPLLGIAAVWAHGGIGYAPYLIDEFTNWIGVSRIIHWAGSYEAVRETLYLPGYTPGWRLLPLMPWQITGNMEFGWSAAAPFVLHVAVLALVYDLIVEALQRDSRLPAWMCRLAGWLVFLLILTAEAMGRLWTSEMLVEQPQIYLLSAALLLLLRAEMAAGARHALHWAAGAALAAGFLLKNAVAAAAPGALLVAVTPLFNRKRPLGARVQESVLIGAALLAPLAAALLSWNAIAPPDGCLASPLSVLSTGIPPTYDPADLARRFGAAVGAYLLAYKLPVTIAAAIGIALGAYVGFFRGTLLWFGFTSAYFAALYWYHLTCFGDYYYQELNSIPRFTRVPLQAFHALGLVLLIVAPLRLGIARHSQGLPIARSAAIAACAALTLVLGAWQLRQTYRSVVDLSSRAYQIVDPRIAEMRDATAFVRLHAGRDLPARPRLAILGQGQDGDVRGYAVYFALQPAPQGPTPLFDVHGRTSWAPVASNVWQTTATVEDVIRELAAVDILWPVSLDPWLISAVLSRLVADPACLARLPNVAMVREAGDRFRCLAKIG